MSGTINRAQNTSYYLIKKGVQYIVYTARYFLKVVIGRLESHQPYKTVKNKTLQALKFNNILIKDQKIGTLITNC